MIFVQIGNGFLNFFGRFSFGRTKIGIASVLFTRGSDTILVFRSTTTDGDFSNAVSWNAPSVVDTDSPLGGTKTTKDNWIPILIILIMNFHI